MDAGGGQFEREATAERIRDKVAASRKKGMWMGGVPPVSGKLSAALFFSNFQEGGIGQ